MTKDKMSFFNIIANKSVPTWGFNKWRACIMANMPNWFHISKISPPLIFFWLGTPITSITLFQEPYHGLDPTARGYGGRAHWCGQAAHQLWSLTAWREQGGAFSFWKRSYFRKCSAWYDPGAHSGSTRPLLGDHGVREAGDQPQEPQSQDRDDGDLDSIKWAFNYGFIGLQSG